MPGLGLGITPCITIKSFGYEPEAVTYFDRVVTNGGAEFSSDWKRSVSDFISTQKTSGNWDLFDNICLIYNEHLIGARTSLKTPSQSMWEIQGSNYVFTPFYGFTITGASTYIKTNYIPSNGTNYTQNSALLGLGIVSNSSGAFEDMGCYSPAPNKQTRLYVNYTAVGYFASVNSYSSGAGAANTAPYNGSYYAVRQDANNSIAYKNDSAISAADASVGVPTTQSFLGAFNNNGTAASIRTSGTYYMSCFGSGSINVANLNSNLTGI